MTKFNTPILREAIASVLAPTKTIISDQHSYVLVRYTDSGVATVEAYNGLIRCSNTATLVEGDPIECLLKASMAINALSGSNGDASIELNEDKSRATIVIGKRKTVIPCLPVNADNWIESKPQKAKVKFNLEKANVFESMKLCASIARSGKLKSRDNIDFATINGTVYITSADGAAGHYIATGVSAAEFSVAIPPATIAEVVANCESDLISVRVFDSSVRFQCGDWSIESALSQNQPMGSRIVEVVKSKIEEGGVSFQTNRKALASAIASAGSIMSDTIVAAVVIETSLSGVSVSSNSGTASMHSEIDAKTGGESSTKVDGSRLIPIVTAHESDAIDMIVTETAVAVRHSESSVSILMRLNDKK